MYYDTLSIEGVSVIVCCYNSASRLPLTLGYLAKQITSELDWEVILVDNNSPDNTADVGINTWESFDVKQPFYVIREEKKGLSYAREAGIKKAKYDIIVLCDDDNLLAPNYIQYAYELVLKTKKHGYAIWGGKPVALFDEHAVIPKWFESEKLNYVVGEQAAKPGDISDRGYVWGAGMIILKKIFLNVINETLPTLLEDRTGNQLTSGGDSEISLRILIAGYKLYYDPGLSLQHYIPASKLTVAYNARLIEGFTKANPILNKYKVFFYYVGEKSRLIRLYYSIKYMIKYLLSKMRLKDLTLHDINVLKALFIKKFNDLDFKLMYLIPRKKSN